MHFLYNNSQVLMVWLEFEYMQVQLLLFNRFESQFCITGLYSNWEEPSGRGVSSVDGC